jgi:DNA-binding NarL/FixJ family response regulator
VDGLFKWGVVRTTILVCEDDPRFSRLLQRVLSAVDDFQVLARPASGEETCRLAAELKPDLLLLDLELPGIDGVQVIRRLVAAGEAPEILVLTSFADEDRVFEAVRAGAAGYLVKGLAPARLVRAVREVVAGGTVIEPSLARRFWNYFASVRGRGQQDYGLTAEELEVLTLVGRGLSNPEAAQALGASRRAIKSHLERIYRKLEVNGRVEATVKALQEGLIEL